ncbi:MAG: hypothetical protein IT293_01735 [Deltaproteobacteria bacterium]|nr:hypothetical protein [Deltaproteobacteria bacterium]
MRYDRLLPRFFLLLCVAVSSAPLKGPASAFAAEGQTDFSFGSRGKAALPSASIYPAIASQSDGSLVVAAQQPGRTSTVVRYTSAGVLDPSFGSAGAVVLDLDAAHVQATSVWSITALPNDHILIAGNIGNYNYFDSGADIFIAQLDSSGHLDMSFGTAGIARLNAGSTISSDEFAAFLWQSDGSIIVAASAQDAANLSNNDVVLLRLTAAGLLDPTFGVNGRVKFSTLGIPQTQVRDIAVDLNSNLLVAGSKYNPGLNSDAIVVRLAPNGTLDASFGGTGFVVYDLAAGDDVATSLLPLADGKVLVGGHASVVANGRVWHFILLRYAADGTLDQSFGTAGVVMTHFVAATNNSPTASDLLKKLFVDSSGRIVAVGGTEVGGTAVGVARYSADGVLDTTFGDDGLLRVAGDGTIVQGIGDAVIDDLDRLTLVVGQDLTVLDLDAPAILCGPLPDVCRLPLIAGKALLSLTKNDKKGNKLSWKWAKGPRTLAAEYGSPDSSTEYDLCIYDANGLIATMRVPPGGMCDKGKPCWADLKGKGFKYKDKAGWPHGIVQLQLKEGLADGKPKIQAKGQGRGLPFPDLSALVAPLTVQLKQNNSATCWSALYRSYKSNGTQLKAKADNTGPTPIPTSTLAQPTPTSTPGTNLCGNGTANSGEVCDGGDLRGQTCATLGFTGGTLACLTSCAGYDSRGCALPASLPPDPALVAPPLDQSVATNVGTATEFLYDGPDRVQYGVTDVVIVPKRAAVVRGRVIDRSGAPLPGVRVSVRDHLEFGITVSRADGGYDLVVNGGGFLNLDFTKTGVLPAQRRVDVPWQDFVTIDDVALVARDPDVTAIDLTAAVPMQIAQGSAQSDSAGTRRATIMIPQGTTAALVLPDGSTQPVNILHLRLTEYTVGPNGPAAMPGTLPPMSAYTYAVEISADEAIAKVAGKDVVLSQPVPVYVDNFLGFAVGEAVPYGYYDNDRGLWIGVPNGVVIAILGVTGGLADLDSDGDGLADSAATLATLGITDSERAALATRFAPGQTFWRVRTSHLSTHDCNWSVAIPNCDPPGKCPSPKTAAPISKNPKTNTPCANGSIIECQNQILRERVPLVGSDMTLNYGTDRVPGSLPEIDIELTNDDVPELLKRVELTVDVAGQKQRTTFPAAANQRDSFTWDRRDAYGRYAQGWQPINVEVAYVYDAWYCRAAQFGFPCYQLGSSVPAREELRRVQRRSVIEGSQWDARGLGLGGWTLSVHHAYDPGGKILYEGNGKRRAATDANGVVRRAVGCRTCNATQDGLPALDTALGFSGSTVERADGSLDVAITNTFNSAVQARVRSLGPDGTVRTIAGGNGFGHSGDGGPATQAQILLPRDISRGPDGSLYILEGEPSLPFASQKYYVRKVAPDGTISTFAGTGDQGYSGDGGPATAATFRFSDTDGLFGGGIAVGPDGALYVADIGNYRIRRVGLDGIIDTVVGTGVPGVDGEGGLATQAQLSGPSDVSFGPDGSMYITDINFIFAEPFYVGPARVLRVTPDGQLTRVAGSATSYDYGGVGDGGQATQAKLAQPVGVDVARDGTLFIADFDDQRVRVVSTDGVIRTLIGKTENGDPEEGQPASQAAIDVGYRALPANNGGVYISKGFATGVDQVASMYAGFSGSDIAIASEDGTQLFQFNASGRHLRTYNTYTGAVLYEFSYDSAGRLTQIRDGDGNVTEIEHDSSGNPAAIVAPFGQRTALSVDSNGFLQSITNPASEEYRFTYDSNGLLERMRNPRSYETLYSYDSRGRLNGVFDAAGGTQGYSRSDFLSGDNLLGYQVERVTGLGRATTYRIDTQASGPLARPNLEYLATTTEPDGTARRVWRRTDGVVEETAANGTTSISVLSPDPRFGMQAPVAGSFWVNLPSGNGMQTLGTRSAILADPTNPLSLQTLTEDTDVNGDVFSTTYDAATRTFRSTSPEGRERILTVDDQGRVTSSQLGNLLPVHMTYDPRGRLITVSQGAGADERRTAFSYNAMGLLAATADAMNRINTFEYDAAGRVTVQTRPDGEEILFSYDSNGNLSSVTPPGRPSHTFNYTAADLQAQYAPPDIGNASTNTDYTYNGDRQIALITRPDGQTINYGYDGGGRIATISAPHGTTTFTYHPTSGQVSSIAAPGAPEGLAYSYDGPLLRSTTWSGTVTGSVERTYDDFFRTSRITVNGTDPVLYSYDSDGLVVQAGAMSVTRDPMSGLITATTLGNLIDTYEYNGFGEMTHHLARFNSTFLYEILLTRDRLGRVATKDETIEGTNHVYEYSYDEAGRLFEVATDGVTTSQYTYDVNGNRLTAPGLSATPAYDDQDRVSSYGDETFTYTASGELLATTNATGTTAFGYDVFGTLRSVDPPGSATDISYAIDPVGRRVGRQQNGTLLQGLLYHDQLRPVAELDASSIVRSRFVFASATNVPDYMLMAGDTYRIITDHLGSPRLVVDVATGGVLQRMRHDDWGRLVASTGAGSHPFGFAGGLSDPDTSLIRFGARDYDPNTGRWMSKDPLGFNAGTNLYSYVDNLPQNSTDPTGECPWCVAVVAIAYGILGHPTPLEESYSDAQWIGDAAPGVAAITAAGDLWDRWGDSGDCPVPETRPPGWTPEWEYKKPEYPVSDKRNTPRFFDPTGGEWRRHEEDKWHPEAHWDYNPWDTWNSSWQNVGDDGNVIPKRPK